MKLVISVLLLGWPLLSVAGREAPEGEISSRATEEADAAGAESSASQGVRVMFGVLPSPEEGLGGVKVEMVAPGSPAGLAGIQAGDLILRLGDARVRSSCQMRASLAAFAPGDNVEVEVRRGEKKLLLLVQLVKKPGVASLPAPDPGYTDRGDRMVYAVSVSPAIRESMREIKNRIRDGLKALPDGLNSREVIRDLQELRDLARDANPSRQGWMVGRAGEALLQFHDESGTLVLHGVNNRLTLEVYDADGRRLLTAPLNTREECRALPEELLERLHHLR